MNFIFELQTEWNLEVWSCGLEIVDYSVLKWQVYVGQMLIEITMFCPLSILTITVWYLLNNSNKIVAENQSFLGTAPGPSLRWVYVLDKENGDFPQSGSKKTWGKKSWVLRPLGTILHEITNSLKHLLD